LFSSIKIVQKNQHFLTVSFVKLPSDGENWRCSFLLKSRAGSLFFVFAHAPLRSFFGPKIYRFCLRAAALLVFRARYFALLVYFRALVYIGEDSPGQHRQERTTTVGQHKIKRTAKQDIQNRTDEEDRRKRTGGTGQQNRSRTRKAEQNRRNKTVPAGLYEMTARKKLPRAH
jgi:hypothetical protein